MKISSLSFWLGLFSLAVSACGSGGDGPVSPGNDRSTAEPNASPVAAILAPGSTTTGSDVTLDGRGSSDPDGDPLAYRWTLSPPGGSASALSSNASPTPSFTADVEGPYLAVLIVNDGAADSAPDTAEITATREFSPFQYAPVNLTNVAFIEPMGSMIGNHVTPIDHQYYYTTDFFQGQHLAVDVLSPGDGTVTSMSHMGSFDGTMDDYRIVIRHTSDISSVYIHVDRLSARLAEFAPGFAEYVNVSIPVSEGEIIGNYSGGVDYNVVDESVTLAGFLNPASYLSEPWKIHVPDPFDYFADSVRSQLLAMCLRTAPPAGGKIDHDIDGRLVGNWFQEGTNGYGGLVMSEYWVGHLAVAYNSVDPDHVIVSFGDYLGEPRQFAVAGNSPDPADVGIEAGVVSYELVDYDFYHGNTRWDRAHLVQGLELRNYAQVHGVVVFHLLASGRLKVEIFPGLTADQVSGFTSEALIYVR